MLAVELASNIIPQIKLQDTVAKALQLMSDFKASHLPVVSEEKYLGLISEDDLLDADNTKMHVEVLQPDFIATSINENEHFLQALNISNQYQTNVVPVVNAQMELTGTITGQTIMKALGTFSGAGEPGGVIVFQMEKNQFAISEISKIVESNDATIIHLNTSLQPENGLLTVTIHINRNEISSVIAAFERYEYDIISYFGEEKFESEIHSNYEHLMNYLDI